MDKPGWNDIQRNEMINMDWNGIKWNKIEQNKIKWLEIEKNELKWNEKEYNKV